MTMMDRRSMAQRLERMAADPRLSLAEAQALDREASRLRSQDVAGKERGVMILPLPRN